MPFIIGMPLMIVVYTGGVKIQRVPTEIVKVEPTLMVSGDYCMGKTLRYVISAKNKSSFNTLLRDTGAAPQEYNNTEELYKDMEKINLISFSASLQGKKCCPSVYGIEFKAITNNSLSIVVHSSDATEQDILTLDRELISETEKMELKDTRRILEHDDLNPLTRDYVYGNNPYITPVSVKKTSRMPEIFLFQMLVLCELAVVIILVAFNVAWDADMKDFLLVMNAGRITIMVAAIICNFVLTLVTVSITYIVPVSLSK
ncbi:hypothetical protein GCK32_011567, partial [Trichostrongylus colubriformis]